MGITANMMNVDTDRLRSFAAENGDLKHISLQLGYSRNYLSNVVACGRMRTAVAKQISAIYGVPEDYFQAREPEPEMNLGDYALTIRAVGGKIFLQIEHGGKKSGGVFDLRTAGDEDMQEVLTGVI